MTYPGAGIPQSTGSAWGTSITAGTGVATALGNAVNGAGGFLTSAATGDNLADSTSASLGLGTIELGHASDTTIARVGAGQISVEGVNVVTTSSADTLTNKTYSTAGTGNDFTAPLSGLLDGAITDPADADDMIYKKVQHALTLTDIHCLAEGGGTITLTLQECDATGASCGNIEGAITCDSNGAEDDGTLTDGSIAAGAWIKAVFSAPTGTVNSLAWTVYGTQVW